MSERVMFPSNGDTADGYLATPGGSGEHPGVVVIQEWWGLVPHVESLADRFAGEGLVAHAPDLYHGEKATEPDQAGKLLMGMAIPRAAKDIAGAATYLAERDDCTGRVGVVGFCMGGTLALWAPTVAAPVEAAVAFYPAPFRDWNELDPSWSKYTSRAALIHAAEGDGGAQAEHVQQAWTAITDAGGDVEVFDYPGTGHAFFNDDRPAAYHAEAAALAWDRTIAFLRERLVG